MFDINFILIVRKLDFETDASARKLSGEGEAPHHQIINWIYKSSTLNLDRNFNKDN